MQCAGRLYFQFPIVCKYLCVIIKDNWCMRGTPEGPTPSCFEETSAPKYLNCVPNPTRRLNEYQGTVFSM